MLTNGQIISDFNRTCIEQVRNKFNSVIAKCVSVEFKKLVVSFSGGINMILKKLF